jgi:hypothetical protein
MATTRKTPASRAKPTAAKPPKQRAAPPQRRAEAHDDSLLESLGKAVSEPVRDAADPEAGEKPE